MTALVLGASAGVGRALARELAARGHRLVLVARHAQDLEAEAAHLKTRFGATVDWVAVDAASPLSAQDALRGLAEGGTIRDLFFPIGMASNRDDGLLPAAESANLVNTNFTGIVAVVSLFLPAMLRANRGNIVGFGSVAAVRGRRANVVYAAAKRGLECYFESLRHCTAFTGVHVRFYRLGYVDTHLNFGRKLLPLPVASPQSVAKFVARNLDRDAGAMFLPRFWWGVCLLVRMLPWSIYRYVQG